MQLVQEIVLNASMYQNVYPFSAGDLVYLLAFHASSLQTVTTN